MSSTNTDQVRVLETGSSGRMWTVAFHPDGKHILGGTNEGVQRWRLGDGQEVGRQMGMNMYAICVSRNHQWIVCGTKEGASVWDGEMHEKVIDVEDTNTVWAIDISPDSTRFATATDEDGVTIWSIASSGERLVGPLKHDGHHITGISFSPTGELIASACHEGKSIQIFDSHTGDKLVSIETDIPGLLGTPLVWSSDSQRIFTPTIDNKIRAFTVSTRSQLTESQILRDGNNDVPSIALATNNKFIATFSEHSISFLDPLTLTRIGSVIEASGQIQAIAISADSSYLATGQQYGKIAIRHLSKLLPDSYGPFHVPTSEEVQQDKEPLTSSGHDNELPDPNLEHRKSSPLESEGHSEDGNRDLLEHEGPPALQSFDYDESMASSFNSHEDPHEDGAPPLVPSHTTPQSDALLPMPSTSETRPKGKIDSVESPQGHSIFTRWRQRVGNKIPASHNPDRRSKESREPADRRSPPAPARLADRQEGPSRMAAASNKIIKLPTSRNKSRRKTATPKHPNKDDPRSAGHGATETREADPMQQATNPSEPSAGRVHLARQEGSADATLSIRFPAWIFCVRSRVQDGTH